MKKIENIPYCKTDNERQTLDLYLPEKADNFPVFVYFHGGGITSGNKDEQKFVGDVVSKGIAVACANYRLYPYAVFPDFVRDAAAAVAWVHNNISDYGSCTDLFVGGSSAGGYITQLLCFDKKYLGVHGIDSDKISGYFMDAGQPTAHFNVLRERGLAPNRVIIDQTAPLYYVESGRNYAPMEIIVSDNDMPNRYEQTRLLVSTLKHCKADMSRVFYKCVENSGHCEYLDKRDENGRYIFADMIMEFINKIRSL